MVLLYQTKIITLPNHCGVAKIFNNEAGPAS